MGESRINPAALRAMLEGDWENALIASTPGGIEAQEARGQRDFVASETLPLEINYGTKEQFEAMGIVFREPVDDLFCAVQLPDGWRKESTNHSMWSDLLDDRGRKRAAIFYKAAFYDRSAHIDIRRRFSCGVEPVLGYDDPEYSSGDWHAVVTDCGERVWSSERKVGPEPNYNDDHQAWRAWLDEKDGLAHDGETWLKEHYPDWRNPTAYWD